MTQRQTQYDQKETEREERRRSIDTTSSAILVSSLPHGAGRVLNPIDMEAIRTGYVDALGPINAYKARDVEWAIENGLEASAILDALEQTSMAARPTHYYFRAILRRYVTEGIHDARAAEAAREEFRAQREAARRETWGAWYHDPDHNMPW